MATIRAYTTIEQSRKLAEILPLENADMTYCACVKDWRGNPVEPKWGKPTTLTKEELALPCSNFQEYEYLPCWSLAALLSVLERGALFKTPQGWACQSYIDFKAVTSDHYDNPIDACVAIIEHLHELKIL